MKGLLQAALAGLAACAGPKAAVGPYTAAETARRSTAEAERLTKAAADLVLERPEEAERLLRRALGEDLFFGPAHNNLGVIFLERGELYAAASEFEWARKLMPGHPGPRLNLAITLDRAGRAEEARAAYTATLEVYPGHLGAIQGLARLAVRSGERAPPLTQWLARIALEGETAQWRTWAARQAASGGD